LNGSSPKTSRTYLMKFSPGLILIGILLMLAGCVSNTKEVSLTFEIADGYSGPIFVIGHKSIAAQFDKLEPVPQDGIVLKSSLSVFWEKRLSDLVFTYRSGRRISPGDANHVDHNIHVWDVGGGGRPFGGGEVRYLIFYIGTYEDCFSSRGSALSFDSIQAIVANRIANTKRP
jgi:hypothetical protein